MKYQGAIFDFNGVLLWDGHLQGRAWGRFSEEKRGVPFSQKEMAIHVHGRNNQHTLQYLMGQAIKGEELHRCTQQKEAIYRRLCLDQGEDFRLSPGAVELLDFLVTNDIPHTIATAAEKTNLAFFVKHLDLTRWFKLEQIVYDDGNRPGKPAPDIYLQAARNLGLDPARCVVVEDSRSGIQAAHAAGTGHIIALGPHHTHSVLTELEGVNDVVENLGQISREQLFVSKKDSTEKTGFLTN
jgi:beta-phosphoglucomutase-like phosphatase (HAD superfamily)